MRYSKFSNALEKYFDIYEQRTLHRTTYFYLSIDEFSNYVYDNCYYCGKPPQNSVLFNKEIFYFSGIDRINNNDGYVIGNCVPCCGECNTQKGTKTVAEFMEYRKTHAK